MKSILLLGAGVFLARSHQILARAGYRVVGCDRDPNAAGGRYCHAFRPVNIVDIPGTVDWARSESVDGVLALNDFGTRAAAAIAYAMGLPGLDRSKVDAVNDKGLMRDVWREAELQQPEYRVVRDLDEMQAATRTLGFPCVVKPTESGGSGRGVSVARDIDEVKWSFDFAAPYAANGRLIVEQYIEGIELTVETVSIPEGAIILAVSDKVKAPGRTRVATSLAFPADIPDSALRTVEQLAISATRALGITVGMAHTEIILAPTGPYLIETGARGGGGHIFHTVIEAVSEICAPTLAAALATGQAVSVPPPTRHGAVYRFFTPPYGKLRTVRNLDVAAALPGVLDVGMIKQPGDIVGDLPNSLHRAGFVVTEGANRSEAVALADRVIQLVEFDVELATRASTRVPQ